MVSTFSDEEMMGIDVVKACVTDVRMVEDRRDCVPSLLYGMTVDWEEDNVRREGRKQRPEEEAMIGLRKELCWPRTSIH